MQTSRQGASDAYRDAGVDIDLAQGLLSKVKAKISATRRPEALAPIGGFGDPGALADWVVFMLSSAADFLCGSIVFVDGGSDAYFRADDWPRPVPAWRGLSYLKRTKEFRPFERNR